MHKSFDLIKAVKKYCEQHELCPPNATIIVGLSGGPDSVFLLHVLHALKSPYSLNLVAAHLDHGWRPESCQDSAFCAEYANSLGLTLISAHASEFPHIAESSGSREEYGRRLRRAFFERCMQRMRPDTKSTVALAHHQDDQIETFFLRLIRGAGVSGLACMTPRSGNYIRPLLGISKTDIVSYLHRNNISYLIDPTNFHNTYLRNRLRSSVLPALAKADARFSRSCLRTIEHIQQAEEFLDRTTKKAFREIATQQNGITYLNLRLFRILDDFLKTRVILHWLCEEDVPFEPTQRFFEEILRFLSSSQGGTHAIKNSWSIVKKHQQAHIQS